MRGTGTTSICSRCQFADPKPDTQIDEANIQIGEAFTDAPHIPEIQPCCVGHKEMQLAVPQQMLP